MSTLFFKMKNSPSVGLLMVLINNFRKKPVSSSSGFVIQRYTMGGVGEQKSPITTPPLGGLPSASCRSCVHRNFVGFGVRCGVFGDVRVGVRSCGAVFLVRLRLAVATPKHHHNQHRDNHKENREH